MHIIPGDIVAMKVGKETSEGLIDTTTTWENVNRVVIPKEHRPSGNYNGNNISAKVTSIEEETAYARRFNFQDPDFTHPGQNISFSREYRDSRGRGAMELPSNGHPNIDEVVVTDDPPVPTFTAHIKKIQRKQNRAYVDATEIDWPQPGETVTIHAKQDSKSAVVPDENYQLPLNEPATISGLAKARIEKTSDGDLHGQIIEYSNEVPEVGSRVEATVDISTDPSLAVKEGAYQIELDEKEVVSGTVIVEITETEPTFAGYVVDREATIPQVGEHVKAHVSRSDASNSVSPRGEQYTIQLQEEIQVSGWATIEITEIDVPMEGKIVEYDSYPSSGDIVETSITSNTENGYIAETDRYAISLEEEPLTTGNVKVEITSISDDIYGTIVDYQGLIPSVGEQVSANIPERGETKATAIDGNYEITLETAALTKGKALVEVTAHGDSVQGQVVEYQRLPDVGSTISAEITPRKGGTGNPLNGDYIIDIKNEVSKTGIASVEIVEISDRVVGKVLLWEDVTQDLDQTDQPSPFSTTDNSAISRRKL